MPTVPAKSPSAPSARHSALWLPLLLALALGALLCLPACHRDGASSAVPADARTYNVRGRIVSIAPNKDTVTIDHEKVPGFMPAMTMPFPIKSPAAVEGCKAGDEIEFRLIVTQSDSWIDDIRKVASGQPRASATPQPAADAPAPQKTSDRVKEGDRMPEFSLVNQDGATITRESFLGQPYVLTFIFTRCPLPNFCPRMMSNFESLQDEIRKASGPAAQVKLLAISFDPDHDSPAVLKEYGAKNSADPKTWTLAVGDKAETQKLTKAFAVYTKEEGGTISHGLTTALVSADGTIKAIWRGNGWSPDEVWKALAQK